MAKAKLEDILNAANSEAATETTAAPVEAEAPAAPEVIVDTEAADVVIYKTFEPTKTEFNVLVGNAVGDTWVYGAYDPQYKTVIWRVPKALEANFDRHYHVQTGRIVKA